MNNNQICSEIEKAIDWLEQRFLSAPTSFYTERELTSTLYSRLTDKLSPYSVPDIDDKPHSLVHLEFPTPFRCDMDKGKFEVKGDDERKEGKNGKKGKKYIRGHYDLIVLNPEVIRQFNYPILKGQNYETFCDHVRYQGRFENPYCLYGIELMFVRDPIKSSRGINKNRAVEEFITKILQDTNKLRAGISSGFFGSIVTLVFVKDTDPLIQEEIKEKLESHPDIYIFFA